MNKRHKRRKPRKENFNTEKRVVKKKVSKLGLNRKWGLGLGTLGLATLFPDTFGKLFETVTSPFTKIFGDLIGGLMPIIIIIIVIMILIAIIRR
tara:strand:- start:6 stop:287 length:282 start_codon:yes stop_codon:yes gene_type:complete